MFKFERQLYVGERKRTHLVEDPGWQVSAVGSALCSTAVPIHAALWFVDGEWRRLGTPFKLRGVLVARPEKLAEAIAKHGPLSPDDVLAITGRLAAALPPMVPADHPAQGLRTAISGAKRPNRNPFQLVWARCGHEILGSLPSSRIVGDWEAAARKLQRSLQ